MLQELTTKAEKQAERAESLGAFRKIKLLHIKDEVTKILSLIGRDGIFDEYTKHDISHIDVMLNLCDKIIPEETQEIMQPADWLLLVLAIYFHDLGMLVTKDEFKNRENTSFASFKREILEDKWGLEYKNKILDLPQEQQDKFIYQELVRRTHGERVKYWILNEKNPDFNIDFEITKEIKELIGNLDPLFLRDLAIVCESHQLSDLEDFEKYNISQPYGITTLEEANVFYIALILRTVDLLHITSDRTPSIEYRLISPTDPISQEEWAKQHAVKNIRPQIKKNKNQEADDSLPKDTLEVTALFQNENGFFALIAYLNYAEKELAECYKLNEKAKKKHASKYEFPWRHIDDSQIIAKDFEKEQFEFVLDQNKILDLLVGHTLYNDPTVVLRELTQNAIDACRLYDYEIKQENSNTKYSPTIKIHWNTSKRILSVIDNGTGMDLSIIKNHLLKVGSSRYQDEKFLKTHKNFSSISRFGIGLLTCFLIADDIDLLTKTENMDKPILLKIRKVHGKYLLKHGCNDPEHQLIANNGTSIKLHVREQVDLSDIYRHLKKWILFTECNILLIIDSKDPLSIGYKDPKDMLTQELQVQGYNIDEKQYKIVQYEDKGIILAFALRYLKYLKEWHFLEFRTTRNADNIPTGTSIEGIRIDFNTPGFDGQNFIAIANLTGKYAPRTNVARSSIENTPERTKMLNIIYSLYLKHITYQLDTLREDFSASWATTEANWLLRSLVSNGVYSKRRDTVIIDPEQFVKALNQLSCILIEKNDNREIITLNSLIELEHFWTIDCQSYESADNLIKEIKSSDKSALSIMKSIYGDENSKTSHLDVLLCLKNINHYIKNTLYEKFQVTQVLLIPEQRRLDLCWKIKKESNWLEFDTIKTNIGYDSSEKIFVQIKENTNINIKGYSAVTSSFGFFILFGSPINTYIQELYAVLDMNTNEDIGIMNAIVTLAYSLFRLPSEKELSSTIDKIIEQQLDKRDNQLFYDLIFSKVNKRQLIDSILATNFNKYDTSIWYRRDF